MKIKGVALKNTLVGLEKVHGKEGAERVKAAMLPRLREMLGVVRPLDWYPIELSAAFHVAIRETFGRGTSWQESRAVSAAGAKIEITGVYRMMVRAVQYDTVWDRMERIWGQYYDAGEARWVERGRGHATGVFSGVRGFNEGMWQSVAGRIDALLQAVGSRGAVTTFLEVGSTRATLEALWLE